MESKKTSVALIHQRQVLSAIRNQQSINKSEIAKRTNMSIPTAVKLTDQLVKQGIVRSCGKAETANGKRPEMYEFAGDAFFSIGVDITPKKLRVVVIDLFGKLIASQTNEVTNAQASSSVISQVGDLLCATIIDSHLDQSHILGVGVGMPGILDVKEGTVLFSPNFHWEKVALRTPLSQRLKTALAMDCDLRIENSNRSLALGEQYFGATAGYQNSICVNLGYGIGSAIIENGDLFTGASGTSGELGHITVERDGCLCTCGNSGCLEALASGRAIALQARNLIASGVQTKINELARGDMRQVEAKLVFEAARQGDVPALDLVRKASEYVGIGLASYVNLLDPEIIVLGGGMANEEIFIRGIREVVAARQMRFAGRNVKIRVSKLGEYATAIGAASIYLRRLLRHGGLNTTKSRRSTHE